ncbi:MAG: acylglycerol kinase family protein, partial [Firmicutes bacterium]|nr:acylglycerol kinase family protein [Bacillota bacterium]
MQTVFIINPAAGAGNDFRDLMSGIALLKENAGEKVSVYETRGVGDAEMFVRKTLEEHPDDMLFVACGGDGTLNEVLNGARGFNNAVISVYPSGTGNDFVRNFPESGNFKDPSA